LSAKWLKEQLHANLVTKQQKKVTHRLHRQQSATRIINMRDCEERAKSAELVYIQEFDTGITRKKCGKGFKYVDAEGKGVTCKLMRKRILELVIPPAWKDVWICLDDAGHIQATGFDEAGRKQYIYHVRWHEASAVHKYGRLKEFARLLPQIRRKVKVDLKSAELNKRRVVAAVVRLLDKACIRIGNRQYLEANNSRGATTLTAENVCRHKHEISLNFKGKSGKQIELKCHDEGLASVIEDCEKSDGEFLFSYQTDGDELTAVTSSDVNSYLLEVTREPVTAKDFRTWRGSVVALSTLSSMEDNLSKTAKKRFVVSAVKAAAAALANTPAVCRKSYIHSAILKTAEEGTLTAFLKNVNVEGVSLAGLTREEIKLVLFLTEIERDIQTAARAATRGKIRNLKKNAAA
jgi:DNA topoisomerase-1